MDQDKVTSLEWGGGSTFGVFSHVFNGLVKCLRRTVAKCLVIRQHSFNGIVTSFDIALEQVERHVGVIVVDEVEGTESSCRVCGVVV